jgi:nitrate/TMAO reductase-like tetraheme cytochrome c subunit
MQQMDPEYPAQPRRGFGSWLWKRPRRWFLLGIPVGGLLAFLAGVGFSGGFAESIHYASSLNFCGQSCHEMNIPYQEYAQSIHYKNIPGVRAVCADCHVPPQFIPGTLRHMKASVEVVQHLLGELNTPAKYEAHRAELAQTVWKELKANNSAECRSCHSFAAMDLDKQDHSAAKMHGPASVANSGETCIDCHKGIAHKLPAGTG